MKYLFIKVFQKIESLYYYIYKLLIMRYLYLFVDFISFIVGYGEFSACYVKI